MSMNLYMLQQPSKEARVFLEMRKGSFFRTFMHCTRTLFLSLILGLLLTGCSSQKTIINGLDEREANEIIVFLSSKGIDAYKTQAKSEGPGGGGGGITFDIAVDSDKAVDAMAVLNANGLPRKRAQNLLQLFNAGGLVPSELQEKVRFQSGLAEQIAGTIRKIDGILDADVQLSFPEEDPLNPQNKKGAVTASVFVKHQGVLDDPNSQLVTKIRRLVASSVQGLNFDNVTVISDKARFSDTSPQAKGRSTSGNTEMVKIWSVVVAKESVNRFQMIFLSVTVALVIVSGFALWFFWKLLPVARVMGGAGSIFSFKSFVVPHGEGEMLPDEGEEEEAEAANTPKKEAKKAQENIESP